MRTPWHFLFAVVGSVSLAACRSEAPREVTINASEARQTMDGFGASTAFFGGTITEAQADQLFDAKKGIGLSLLRTMIGVPDDIQSDGSQPNTGAVTVATAPELATARQARARGVKVWATAWTPPPIWKTTNNRNGSGQGYPSNKLKSEHYQAYADYLAEFVDLMDKNGVPLIGLSPANEPDYTASWDGAQWTPEELATFIAENLGPTFERRCPSVQIVAPDTANFSACDRYVSALFANSKAKGYVPIVATHPYPGQDVGSDYQKPQQNGKRFWETEWSQENMQGDKPDPSMTSAIWMAKQIHENMVRTEMNAWSWWAITVNKQDLNDDKRQNPAFLQPDASLGQPFMFKRGYAFGNWSKFVRPGFKRIQATDTSSTGALVEAYRDDAGHLAIVAINPTTRTIAQELRIQGGSFGQLTPWVTSPSDDDNLTAKKAFSATDRFTYELPAQSVVTFVTWDATTETPALVIPPGFDGGTDPPNPSTGLDCSAAVVPSNGGEGGVTDFTDWKGSTGRWGDSASLWGNVYSYPGPKSTMSHNVDTAAKNLHGTGSVAANDYGGIGLSFSVCAKVMSFSRIQFTIAGSWPGCDLELQMKTFDQQPTTQTPAGGCDESAGSCYNFPAVKRVAMPSTEPQTITVPLADLSGWSPANAAQVVGMQWQFTGTNVDPDAGTGCPINMTVTNVKFLP